MVITLQDCVLPPLTPTSVPDFSLPFHLVTGLLSSSISPLHDSLGVRLIKESKSVKVVNDPEVSEDSHPQLYNLAGRHFICPP